MIPGLGKANQGDLASTKLRHLHLWGRTMEFAVHVS